MLKEQLNQKQKPTNKQKRLVKNSKILELYAIFIDLFAHYTKTYLVRLVRQLGYDERAT
jgi:hypothetical protein